MAQKESDDAALDDVITLLYGFRTALGGRRGKGLCWSPPQLLRATPVGCEKLRCCCH